MKFLLLVVGLAACTSPTAPGDQRIYFVNRVDAPATFDMPGFRGPTTISGRGAFCASLNGSPTTVHLVTTVEGVVQQKAFSPDGTDWEADLDATSLTVAPLTAKPCS